MAGFRHPAGAARHLDAFNPHVPFWFPLEIKRAVRVPMNLKHVQHGGLIIDCLLHTWSRAVRARQRYPLKCRLYRGIGKPEDLAFNRSGP
jgi:hypothetical protein